jgi:hypothetical protein
MLGKRSSQRGLFEADNQYLDFVGRESFYGFLASQRGKLFRDEDFAEIYCPDNGRPSVAPSLLANALLLQTHDKVSDEEAKGRADYDLRWKVALGIEVDERPFAKSTLQLFRAQLVLKEKMRAVFTRSLELAKQAGYLKARRLRVILDTTNILGRGAVKDTYNLLGDGIQQLCRALAAAQEATLKEGVSRDRIVSVHDPEMRHGRKSSSKRFDGHKAAIAVDADSQLITAVEVLPGNAADAGPALSLTEESEQNTGLEVEETVGDCAFGDGHTRQEFANAERKLVARVADHGRKGQIHKSEFRINLEAMTCTCPAGHTTAALIPTGFWLDKQGQKHPRQSFAFPVAVCAACPLRPQCIKTKAKRGRTVSLHPQEDLLQQARAFQQSPEFQPYRQMRQTAEHRLARLVQLGIRQARSFGRKKTLFQLWMAATVANLTLIATQTGQMRAKIGRFFAFFARLEALREALRRFGDENGHLGQVFQRRLATAVSELPVFG